MERPEHKSTIVKGRGHDVPDFRKRSDALLVPTLRTRAWKFYKEARRGVEAANRTHIVIRLPVVDPRRMQAAFRLLHLKHPILSSTHLELDGAPWIQMHDNMPFELDLFAPVSTQREVDESSMSSLISSYFMRPFDLNKPLLRAFLMPVHGDQYALGIGMHHLISDATSIEIVARDVVDLYRTMPHPDSFSVSEERIGYQDYLLCRSEWLATPRARIALDYWRDMLPPDQETLRAPFSFPGSHYDDDEPGRLVFQLDPALSGPLEKLRRTLNTTTFVVILCVHAILIAKAHNSDRAYIACVTNGRPLGILQPVVGFLSDCALYVIDCNGDPTFEELVRRAHKTVHEVRARQYIPYDYIHDEIWGKQSKSVFLPLLNFRPEIGNRPPLDSEAEAAPERQFLPAEPGAAKYISYEFELKQSADGQLRGWIQFSRDGSCQILDWFSAALRDIPQHYDKPISEIWDTACQFDCRPAD